MSAAPPNDRLASGGGRAAAQGGGRQGGHPAPGGGARPPPSAGGASALLGLFDRPPTASSRSSSDPFPAPTTTTKTTAAAAATAPLSSHVVRSGDDDDAAGERAPLLPKIVEGAASTPSEEAEDYGGAASGAAGTADEGGTWGNDRDNDGQDDDGAGGGALSPPPPPPPPPSNGAADSCNNGNGNGNVVSWDDDLLPRPWSVPVEDNAAVASSKSFAPLAGQLRRRASRFASGCLHRLSSVSLAGFFVGSTTSVLYHCVFSLAMASSVTRRYAPDPSVSLLGPVAKLTALGIVVAGPPLIYALGPETPALYVSADLFLAPFLSEMGRVVDETLHRKRAEMGVATEAEAEDDTAVFLGSFAALAALGMLLSSFLCILAAKVKLANLGAFLPHAVICGFFSSIGVMVWTLSFGVDTGAKVQDVVLGRAGAPSWESALLHHAPSFAAGAAMKILCPRNAVYLPLSIGVIIVTSYLLMLATGTSLDEAQRDGWFWTTDELIGDRRLHGTVGYASGPPAPFGVLEALLRGQVDPDAIVAGLPTVVAMALIYALRCSLHAVALKKLAALLAKKKMVAKAEAAAAAAATASSSALAATTGGGGGGGNGGFFFGAASPSTPSTRRRMPRQSFDASVMSFGDVASFDDGSEGFAIDLASLRSSIRGGGGGSDGGGGTGQGKRSLDNLRTLLWYGIGHLLSAIAGGFSGLPAFAVGAVLSELGVEGLSPQYGGVAILAFIYVTDFSVVSYIPKAVFSSLLVLCFLDFVWKWFVQSYVKTKDIWEWLVVPAIVAVAFVVPLLEAVVLGVAASTFIFVGAFYGSGVVKFASTGLSVRSTVDRMDNEIDALDNKGDIIQILVLQNYMFFGNASSVLQYIQTMFEEPALDHLSIDFEIPPVPKYIVLDFSLVTGMDTSSVDIISEMLALCKEERCALLFSGLSKKFKSILSCGGVKPTPNLLLFCYDLDTALGKAEDSLLNEHRKIGRHGQGGDGPNGGALPAKGLQCALAQIETLQGLVCIDRLKSLERYTREVTVRPHQYLFGSDLNPNGGIVPENERGLFFIERGTLRIERDSNCLLTSQMTRRTGKNGTASIGHMNARSATVAKLADLLKTNRAAAPSRPFRLAKIGPGWVIGAVEGCSGLRNPGAYAAVSECLLHHLPYSELRRIEEDDPLLALNLFKLLAHIVSRRQISAIEQLGNLHSIITSPPLSQPRNRVTMGAINSAVKGSGLL